jgi:hypothetical protein
MLEKFMRRKLALSGRAEKPLFLVVLIILFYPLGSNFTRPGGRAAKRV